MEAMFGAGCFWGVEETFRLRKGVTQTSVGYAGGSFHNPTYEDVCSGATGHAEVVHLMYDASIVSYEELLKVFWTCHDPTQLNRQGPDVGSQYRSVIFYYDDEQKKAAISSKEHLDKEKVFPSPIATVIEKAPAFYQAEDYHQQFLKKRGPGFSCG